MEMLNKYSFGKTVELQYSDAVAAVRAGLETEGFGVLTEIDVKKKFQEKLGREFRNYVILGACNPPLAWEAFQHEINIGTLLPCNVAVYEMNDGKSAVMVMDPVAALGLIDNKKMVGIALLVRDKMRKMLDSLR